jgi:formamidopyrimidine-DNA glycosylase
LLADASIERIDRRGKLLAIIASDGRAVGVHLGMTGQLLWAPAGGRLPGDHVHTTWRLDDRSRLVFRDPRRFGGLWVAQSRDELPPWLGLGPDALTLPARTMADRLAGVRRPIKAALLDQGLIAGVGNIYADEALHRAGIHPGEIAGDLSPERARALGGALRQVLRQAVRSGGSTLRDYRSAEGQSGAFQLQHAVYGRGGEPCLQCGATLERAMLAQRTTVWCPACQALAGPQSAHELSTSAGRGWSDGSAPSSSSI